MKNPVMQNTPWNRQASSLQLCLQLWMMHICEARAADIKDMAKRILNNLLGVVDGGIHSDVPVILAADDLAPSETLQLDKSKILGFVTMGGSGNSHTAILARTMGIPAICGAGEALAEGYNGRVGYIDGETGQLIIDPDAMTQAALKEKI